LNSTFKSPLIKGKEVSLLIPQKPPIEMVDTLWYNDETTTVSGFTIHEDNIFCEEGFLKEPGLIENIAQTAALRVGYMVAQMKSDNESITPPIGYIGAIKNLNIYSLPKAGIDLVTKITIENVVFEVTIIKGIISQNDETIAECEMKIFLTGN
jgi:3-hydroxyacyl-[acyl-carrier-protein] dehydratase